MSGICGAWAFDGGEPDLDPLLAKLERRGPDGTHRWRDGPVALGHTLLATTPEALVEVLPLTEPDSGCTITADARLDNREELIVALDLAGEVRVIGDGELILRAYLKWDEDCPTHLLGDFAFAIWDSQKERLFCARDHMGMRQFNYCHVSGKVFAFATIDTALLASGTVPGTVNGGRIADFIADLEGYDFTSTFFEHIHRLAPAHLLTIGPGGQCNVSRYWTLRPGSQLDLPSDEAYAAAFLTIFTEAVRSRTRTAGGLGAMLSGGLDSSSVVAVAAGIQSAGGEGPLKTISAVAPDAVQCPETQAIHLALSIEGLDPILVSKKDFGGKRDELLTEMDDVRNPFEVHMTMLRAIYMTARDNGLNVVLDGGAGDVILTADNRVASLLAQYRFSQAWEEATAARRFWNAPPSAANLMRELLSAAWVAFAPIGIRSVWRTLRLSRQLPDASPEFAARVDFAERRRAADRHVSVTVRTGPARRAQLILHPNLASGRERYDQVSGSFGVESRDPFMDLRVIEFCLSLPAEQLQVGGWPKIILRRAIEALVPQDIAWRRGKEHLGGDFTESLLETWPEWADRMCSTPSPLSAFLDERVMRDVCATRNDAPTALTMRLFALDRFLRSHNRGKTAFR